MVHLVYSIYLIFFMTPNGQSVDRPVGLPSDLGLTNHGLRTPLVTEFQWRYTFARHYIIFTDITFLIIINDNFYGYKSKQVRGLRKLCGDLSHGGYLC